MFNFNIRDLIIIPIFLLSSKVVLGNLCLSEVRGVTLIRVSPRVQCIIHPAHWFIPSRLIKFYTQSINSFSINLVI